MSAEPCRWCGSKGADRAGKEVNKKHMFHKDCWDAVVLFYGWDEEVPAVGGEMPKPRIKMGELPGDVSRQKKIAMMEGRIDDANSGRPSFPITKKAAKSYKKTVRMKEKAVLKKRVRKEVEDEMQWKGRPAMWSDD